MNVAVDALSHDNMPLFFQEVPNAIGLAAEPILDELQELLVHQRLD